MKLHVNKKMSVVLTVVIIAFLIFLPLYMGTKTYPIAIVQGNSMYPTLQSGDIVFFKLADQQSISKGTIIVFVQSDTGVTMLDSLTKPTVIHRVVGSFAQADGTICYNTKGDNNKENDSSAISANQVLGSPVLVIPKVGVLILFLTSPSGLVATIGFITIYYLGINEGKLKEDKAKETFLGELARMVVNCELPEEIFKKFELAVKCVSCAETNELKDSTTRAMLDWLRSGALEKGWTINKTPCPKCSGVAITVESNKEPLIICPQCILQKQEYNSTTQLRKNS